MSDKSDTQRALAKKLAVRVFCNKCNRDVNVRECIGEYYIERVSEDKVEWHLVSDCEVRC